MKLAISAALAASMLVPAAQAETRVYEFNLAWSNQDFLPGVGVRTAGALFDGPMVARLTLDDVLVDGQQRVRFKLESLFAGSGLPFGLGSSTAPSIGSLRFDAPGATVANALPLFLDRTGPVLASATRGNFSTNLTDGLDPDGDPNLALRNGYSVNFQNLANISAFNDGETAVWEMAGAVADFSADPANRPWMTVTNFRVQAAGPAEYLGVTVENVASVIFSGQVVAVIPEPGTWMLWLAGLAAVAGLARRRR